MRCSAGQRVEERVVLCLVERFRRVEANHPQVQPKLTTLTPPPEQRMRSLRFARAERALIIALLAFELGLEPLKQKSPKYRLSDLQESSF